MCTCMYMRVHVRMCAHVVKKFQYFGFYLSEYHFGIFLAYFGVTIESFWPFHKYSTVLYLQLCSFRNFWGCFSLHLVKLASLHYIFAYQGDGLARLRACFLSGSLCKMLYKKCGIYELVLYLRRAPKMMHICN